MGGIKLTDRDLKVFIDSICNPLPPSVTLKEAVGYYSTAGFPVLPNPVEKLIDKYELELYSIIEDYKLDMDGYDTGVSNGKVETLLRVIRDLEGIK